MSETMMPVGSSVPSFLDEDLSTVDTSFPILAEDNYQLVVKDIKLEANKNNTGQNLEITLATTAPARKKGAQMHEAPSIPAGLPLRHMISLTETEKYNLDSIKKKVAEFVQAAGGRTLSPLDQYKGRIVTATVKIQPERTEEGKTYPENNRVYKFIKMIV